MSDISSEINIEQLLVEVKQFATDIILNYPDTISYHDIDFAQRLLAMVDMLASKEELSDQDTHKARIIAWLFATGFENLDVNISDSQLKNNISDSAITNTQKLFTRLQIDDSRLAQEIYQGLQNINLPKTPTNQVEMVVSDSLTADLVCHDDDSVLKSVYQEMILQDVNISKRNWYDVILSMGEQVKLYTKYGQETIQPRLDKVLLKVKEEKAHIEDNNNLVITKELKISEKELKKLKKRVKNMKGRDDRALQTLFRTTSKNHYTLNEMVDRKANIMITVNSIILSLVISGVIGRQPLEHVYDYIPIILLTLTSMSSIIFAILSILPNRTQGKFSEEEIRGKKGNLLYFGNFHDMKQRDYEWGMLQMMNDSEYLYSSMIRDIYYLGQILYSKYSLIRWSLRIFLGGFILSLLSFGILRIFFHSHSI